MKSLVIGAALAATLAPAAIAGPIERACLSSDRNAATRSLCGCIQDVADITLSGSDQRLAASFFRNPGKAQEIRQSDRRRHEVFWEKYKAFGRSAESYCG